MYMIVNKARGKIWFSLFGAMAGVLAALAETVSGTPDAYLDYIEATGQQYINTGVNAETGLKARADFSWGSVVSTYDDWGLLGAKDGKAMLWDKVSETFFRNKGNYLIAGGGWEWKWHENTVILLR